MDTPDKILVIRFSSIGDIVLASPLLRGVRSTFPTAQIDFVTKKEFAELVRSNHSLNYTYEYDSSTGFEGLRTLKRQIAREHYDLVIDLHNSLRSRFVRSLRGPADIVVVNKRVMERTALVKFKKNLYRSVVPVADRYLETVARWGVVNDGKGLDLHITDETLFSVNARMARLKLHRFEAVFGLCPGARHLTKRWPSERFAAAGIQLVKEYDGAIVLLGASEDRETTKAIAAAIGAAVGPERVIDLAGELTLMESAAALEYLDVVVTNDSGLMHIAAARRRPLVAIFGSTVREFGFFPVHSEATVLEVPDLACRPCSHIGRSSCPEGHLRCLLDTGVESVVKAVLHRRRTSTHTPKSTVQRP